MPSERFYNLPAEKQGRILEAAAAELARVPWDQLSINKIIQTAEISRGSFYQYFADKIDLLRGMMAQFMEDLTGRIRSVLRREEKNIFAAANVALETVLEYGFQPDYFPVFRNLFPYLRLEEISRLFPLLPLALDLEAPPGCHPQTRETFQSILDTPLYAGIPKERLLDTLEIIIALFQYTITQSFFYMEQKSQIQQGFQRKLKLLEASLHRKEQENVEI